MTESQREQIFATARDLLLVALPDAWAIYVYGSLARGEEWPDSDLDLAVLLPPGQKIPDVFDLIGKISSSVRRDIDLVDLRKVGDVLRSEVLSSGKTLFASRPQEVLAWEASALSRYARHREEIRDLLQDFGHTGVGYART